MKGWGHRRNLLLAAVVLLGACQAEQYTPMGAAYELSVVNRFGDDVGVQSRGDPERSGLLGSIRAYAQASDGSLLVLDRSVNQIVVFSGEGQPLHSFGGRGRGPGEFLTPVDLAIDRQGRALVLDYDLRRVSYFSSDGAYLFGATVPISQPLRILTSPEGPWIVSSLSGTRSGAKLSLISMDGEVLREIHLPSGEEEAPGSVPSVFLDQEGNFIVAGERPGLWDVLSRSGSKSATGHSLIRNVRGPEYMADVFGQQQEVPPDAATVAVLPIGDHRLVWFWTTGVHDLAALTLDDLDHHLEVFDRAGNHLGSAQWPEDLEPIPFYAGTSRSSNTVFLHVEDPFPMVVELMISERGH
jgi:hypothetical protein